MVHFKLLSYTVTYVYDGAGNKLSVAYNNKSDYITTKTEYVGNKVYRNGTLNMLLTEEGYATLSGTTPTYYYYLKDHQGNNRVVINQGGAVQQVNHYYAFGGLFGEGIQTSNQPYRYNGKELDRFQNLDMYDYGARHYDAALGRWFTVDPLAEKYYSISPYVYVANNPIKFIDLDGREILIYYKNAQGNTESFRFTGYNERNVKHTNSFVNKVIQAYNYNVKNGGGNALMLAAFDKDVTIRLVETDLHNVHVLGEPPYVYWNPEAGLETTDGDVLSPTTGLEHEVDHAYNYVKNTKDHNDRRLVKVKGYDNKEEQRVIEGNEYKTAKANGEIGNKNYSRKDHRGKSVIVEGGITSTKINEQKTEEYQKRLNKAIYGMD